MAKPLPVAAVVLPSESSGVRARADLFVHAAHLCDAARIVRDRPVGIRREGDPQRGEHPHRGDADAEHPHLCAARSAGGKKGAQNGRGNDEHGRQRREHAQRRAVDEHRTCAALGGRGEVSGRFIGCAREHFGEESDQHARRQPDEDGRDQPQDIRPRQSLDAPFREQPEEQRRNDGRSGGGKPCAGPQRAQQPLLRGVLLRPHEKGAEHGEQDADRRDPERDERAEKVHSRRDAQRHRREQRADVRLIQVGAHARHVAHVVAHIVGDDGWIAVVVFGDILFHLADKVGAHVCRLGKDASAHAREQRHARSAHAEGDHIRRDKLRLPHSGRQDAVKSL